MAAGTAATTAATTHVTVAAVNTWEAGQALQTGVEVINGREGTAGMSEGAAVGMQQDVSERGTLVIGTGMSVSRQLRWDEEVERERLAGGGAAVVAGEQRCRPQYHLLATLSIEIGRSLGGTAGSGRTGGELSWLGVASVACLLCYCVLVEAALCVGESVKRIGAQRCHVSAGAMNRDLLLFLLNHFIVPFLDCRILIHICCCSPHH